ncbi:putative glutamate carboxypeptidase 2 [Panicum miliaceum]|uniref:Glutamate carboxypeptidase 2 n=1 Tax=Panicum miliaceum TaxID=4540 RepID=A0A3L6STB2_PANMI|nr:putative glutamate carboxypeptidase 2 [Panicum miliaceum]
MWASSDGCERLSVEEAMRTDDMPLIPALPVSARDAMEIHGAIGGAVAPAGWQGRKDGPVYRLGPGPAVLNLTYLGNDTMATIENVFAIIEGAEEPDRYVILGNHRDAWTFGASDPNSGTAAMIETGSTEWVEENQEMLSSRAVAYLNIDVSVVDPGFLPSTTPQLDKLLQEITKVVLRLGDGGSDYSAFAQHAGIPSMNIVFGEGPGYPVYHSLYDDYVWMAKFGDPGFRRHVAAASIWGMMALRLANDEIIPFNYMSYASELEAYTKVLENGLKGTTVTCSPLYNSIKDLRTAATKANNEQKEYFVYLYPAVKTCKLACLAL